MKQVANKKKEISHYLNKLKLLDSLYSSEELSVGFDTLEHHKTVNQELLYFNCGDREQKGIFIFSNDFFIKELRDQEIKKTLSYNYLNLKIYHTYLELKRSCDSDKFCEGVRVNEILDKMAQNNEKNITTRHKALSRILMLAYYHNWDLKKDRKSIDTDYFITIPNNFCQKLKQRFNLRVLITIEDNEEILFFINVKGDLNFILKSKNSFNKKDVEKIVLPYIKKEFGIKKLEICTCHQKKK